jgi:hypothetical protein
MLNSALQILFAHKASICHCSHSTVNIDNAVAGKKCKAYLYHTNLLGMTDERQLCVAAFSERMATQDKLSFDLLFIGHSESTYKANGLFI